MMDCRRSVIALFRPAFAALLVFCSLPLHGERGITVVPPPGAYSSDQMLSISAPEGSRLTVIMNGSRIHDAETPLLLSAQQGEQQTYRLKVELHSLAPSSPLIETKVFEWIIDKKRPAAPSFKLERDDGGVRIAMASDEPVILQYIMYQPYYKAVSRGKAAAGEKIFLPDGGVLCAHAVDRAGNPGNPSSVTAETGIYSGPPVTIVNPVPGTWANRQTLVLDMIAGIDVRYSVDGSDPANNGTLYTAPVLIDKNGPVTIRIAATDPDGNPWTDSVIYTVQEQLSGLEQAVSLTGGIYETGTFFERTLPEGFTATIGNPWQSGRPQKSLLFSVPEGIRRMYPVTVRRGNVFWRWVCAAGSPDNDFRAIAVSDGDSLDTGAEHSSGPRPVIHNWHFVSITGDAPVFYSHDKQTWIRYTGPVVLDRTRDALFYWYSPVVENGTVNTVSLPAKPVLSGPAPGTVTADPVFLSVSPSPFTLYYAFGSHYPPAAPPEKEELMLASGVLLETPQGASEPYTVLLRAVHEGMVHGDLAARFLLDRKAPRAPSFGIPDTLSYSREPVSLRITGEDMIQIAITPDLFEHTGSEWILSGHPDHPVTYTVSSFAIDRAGNRSDTVKREITVDRNALYVDGTYTGMKSPDGSPDAPFTDLDSALSVITGGDSWRISVSGNVRLEDVHTLRAGIAITGMNATIVSGERAAIRCFSNTLSLSSLTINRPAQGKRLSSGGTGGKAFLEIANGSLHMQNCVVRDSSPEAGAVIKAENATISLHSSKLALDTHQYATLLDIRNSSLFVRDCHFDVSSRVVSAVSISGGRAAFHDSEISVAATGAARALEVWGASLVIRGLRLHRSDNERFNNDTAFWKDHSTVILAEQGLETTGFKFRMKSGEK